MNIRLAIIDDEELMRTGFAMILEAVPEFKVVGQADDGTEAVDLCKNCKPDVVLLDVRMPNCDGIKATQQLTACPDISTKILILTTFDYDRYVFEAIRAGASGFLLKDTPADYLVHAIKIIAAGESILSPTVTRKLIEAFVTADKKTENPAPTLPPEMTELSNRELDVLRLLAQGLSNSEIASRLFLSRPTVKSHISSLLSKLAVRDRLQAVIKAYQTGLVQPDMGKLL